LIIKFHPITTKLIIDKWIDAINVTGKENILFVHGEERTYDLMAMSDLFVISEPSTTGIETLAYGKPLVQLKLSLPDTYPYRFVEDKAALHLTPVELVEKLKSETDFSTLMDKEGVEYFIGQELTDTSGAADRIIDIMTKSIEAREPESFHFNFDKSNSHNAVDWSIILPISNNPEFLISVLESISRFSEGKWVFEVILIEEEEQDPTIIEILDTLEGDVKRVSIPRTIGLSEQFNIGATNAAGERLIFLNKDITVTQNWLGSLEQAFRVHPTGTIFGAKVINRHNNIVHAGVIIDANNSPVSAYKHLDNKFPHVLKKRSFQMVNHFVCIDRDQFKTINGFHNRAGRYAFYDISLKVTESLIDSRIIYLPKIELVKLDDRPEETNYNESIFFHSRWHDQLWESEEAFYKKDGVSKLQLDAARMTRAMGAVGG